ncbi:MAG: hypothetical protein ACJAQU_001899 [Loktanella salsilacus]
MRRSFETVGIKPDHSGIRMPRNTGKPRLQYAQGHLQDRRMTERTGGELVLRVYFGKLL